MVLREVLGFDGSELKVSEVKGRRLGDGNFKFFVSKVYYEAWKHRNLCKSARDYLARDVRCNRKNS